MKFTERIGALIELQALSSVVADEKGGEATAEKGSVALAKLVERGIIDPVFAENLLDTSFSLAAFTAAMKHSTSTINERQNK